MSNCTKTLTRRAWEVGAAREEAALDAANAQAITTAKNARAHDLLCRVLHVMYAVVVIIYI